ncbi:MAG: isocitrate lyase [Acidobacteria bacterium]|nr:MAG: isocitrate lyase [Acidobacteriota bacterium]
MKEMVQEIQATKEWFNKPRFKEITRLYSARQVVEQRGTIRREYSIAKNAASEFYTYLREQFAQQKSITTFGPYSPGQVVMMKRMGIKGIYLGGWATSAKGSVTEDQSADLASYPLSQVPDEASTLVRALLSADKNQRYARARMTEEERKATPEIDYRPFIIADADTGHGGDAHVRNLVRRFVEVGVTGYHIEDQRPGTKKCGHQGGKVLVSVDEQIKRLNSARFQLDVMGVEGLIVARTDAEAATLLDNNGDGRDHYYILGATNLVVPSYKLGALAVLKRFFDAGLTDVNGHQLYNISDSEYEKAYSWFKKAGILSKIDEAIETAKKSEPVAIEKLIDEASYLFLAAWETDGGVKTYADAVVDAMKFRSEEGVEFDMNEDQWRSYAKSVSHSEAKTKAQSMGVDPVWDMELARTPEGYYQIRGGIEYAITKSLAIAPFCDLIWMETKTADLKDAKEFAEAIHAVYPEKMLAYNLSPSFNWDTTGMTDQEMSDFPEELGKLGFVFNFITYGGHQIDGLAAEEFATALMEEGMLALAKLQRKLRLLESPYKTPQTLVGGKRLDGALVASSGRTATTKAMGKGSTQFQHLVYTEVPKKLLESWLATWSEENNVQGKLKVKLRPHIAGSDILELSIQNESGQTQANVVFTTISDRKGLNIMSVRDQNTFNTDYRQKRLMTLLQLYLLYRYKVSFVHYVTPTEDNQHQTKGMEKLGLFKDVHTEVGNIIVADVCTDKVEELVTPEGEALGKLISKK